MVQVRFLHVHDWISDARYSLIIKYGLPALGLTAGFLSAPPGLTILFGIPATLATPVIWTLLPYFGVILREHSNIPRAMLLSNLLALMGYNCLSCAVFHTLGAVLHGATLADGSGLQAAEVLPYGVVYCGVFLAFRVARRAILSRNRNWLAEADRRSTQMATEISSMIDPRLLSMTLNRHRAN